MQLHNYQLILLDVWCFVGEGMSSTSDALTFTGLSRIRAHFGLSGGCT
jgi:hypothetical protein